MEPGRSPIPLQPGWGIRNLLGTPGDGLPQSRVRRPSTMAAGVSSSGPPVRRATSVSSMAESTSNSSLPPGLAWPRPRLPGSHTKSNRCNYRHKNRHKHRYAFVFPDKIPSQGASPDHNWDRTWDKNRDTLARVSARGPELVLAVTTTVTTTRHDGRTRYWTERMPRPAGGFLASLVGPRHRRIVVMGVPVVGKVILTAVLSTVPCRDPGWPIGRGRCPKYFDTEASILSVARRRGCIPH